jgi:peroxiredoxin
MTVPLDFGIDFTTLGPAVGERFPDIVLPDQHGTAINLHQVRQNRRALVVVYRSADWCPSCKAQLVELQQTLPELTRHDIVLFALSYDRVAVLAAFAATHGITYPLLSDVGSQVIRALGLYNEHLEAHHAAYGMPTRAEHWGVPYPGVFLLDAQGRVMQKRFQQSYRERETGVALLEQGFGCSSALHGEPVSGQAPGVQVSARLDTPTYRAFQRLWLTVDLQIDPGLHVYGHPIPEGFIPLAIDVTALEGLTVGMPVFPAPTPHPLEGLDEMLFMYEGRLTVAVPLTFTQADDDTTLCVRISYQACSEAGCFMPQQVELRLPVQAQSPLV